MIDLKEFQYDPRTYLSNLSDKDLMMLINMLGKPKSANDKKERATALKELKKRGLGL